MEALRKGRKLYYERILGEFKSKTKANKPSIGVEKLECRDIKNSIDDAFQNEYGGLFYKQSNPKKEIKNRLYWTDGYKINKLGYDF